MAEEPAIGQTEHSFGQPRDHLARQRVLCRRVCACGDGEQDARSVLEQPNKTYLWIRRGAALGRRTAEPLLIRIGVQYAKRGSIHGDNSPRSVPRTFQPLLRQRPDEAREQLFERLDTKPLTRLGDRRFRRQRSMNRTILHEHGQADAEEPAALPHCTSIQVRSSSTPSARLATSVCAYSPVRSPAKSAAPHPAETPYPELPARPCPHASRVRPMAHPPTRKCALS